MVAITKPKKKEKAPPTSISGMRLDREGEAVLESRADKQVNLTRRI